jgi:DNA topoisomerase-1
VHSLIAFKELGMSETITETKRKIVAALDMVAKQLGNTRTVCKKYYVHPAIITLYENRNLHNYLSELETMEQCDKSDLVCEEKLLMKILEKEGLIIK